MNTTMKKNISTRFKPLLIASTLCATLFYVNTASAVDNNEFKKGSHKNHFMQGMNHQGGKGKKSIKKMIKVLGLSESQQVQIKAIRAQAKGENIALRFEMKAYKHGVKALIQAKEFDEQAFIALHSNNQKNYAEIALKKAKMRHAILQILTAEQRVKWQAFMEMKMLKKRKNSSGSE